MNPLVSEMLNTVAGQDTELMFLEGLLEGECKCQSGHTDPENRYCSGDVAWVGLSCTPPLNVCDAAAKAWVFFMERGNTCADCKLPCRECWEVRPI